MVSFKELVARIKQHFRFSKYELQGLIAGVLITGFIFSFRFWGVDEFDFFSGLINFVLVTIAAGISFFGHVAAQKVYALTAGYTAEFRTWWAGLVIALVLAFLSAGYITLVFAGGFWLKFMVRQRLGQFRYGYNQEEQAIAGMWGMLGSLMIAAAFRCGNLLWPAALFFERGMMISIVFAICSVLPLHSLDGLNIFFGSRGIYMISVVVAVAGTLLLLFGGWLGLLFGAIVGLIVGGVAILYGSEI